MMKFSNPNKARDRSIASTTACGVSRRSSSSIKVNASAARSNPRPVKACSSESCAIQDRETLYVNDRFCPVPLWDRVAWQFWSNAGAAEVTKPNRQACGKQGADASLAGRDEPGKAWRCLGHHLPTGAEIR